MTNEMYPSYQSFQKSKFLSIKHDNFFPIYEKTFQKYRGKPIVFVEIGIFHGGSLFMWRDYFGKDARIIGIDLDPGAKKWEEHGFEIWIGDQSDPKFWQDFFATVGSVDIVLDDGGHTNEHQLITTLETLPNINDGGVLLVEDVYTSYSNDYGNPSRYSFINFCKNVIDIVNSRYGQFSTSSSIITGIVWSTEYFESVVCFHVDRTLCTRSFGVWNEGFRDNATDFRYEKVNILVKGVRLLSVLLSTKDLTVGNRNASFAKLNPMLQSRAFRWIRLLLQPLNYLARWFWTLARKYSNLRLSKYFRIHSWKN